MRLCKREIMVMRISFGLLHVIKIPKFILCRLFEYAVIYLL